MTDEEFLAQSRAKALEMQQEFVRLIRTHADTMDIVRDMFKDAGKAAASSPRLLFEKRGTELSHDPGDIVGGQAQAVIGGAILDGLIGLVKQDGDKIKETIKGWVGRLFSGD